MKTKSIKTVKKTVIKYKLLFFALLFFNLCFSQEKKQEKKEHKTIYVKFDFTGNDKSETTPVRKPHPNMVVFTRSPRLYTNYFIWYKNKLRIKVSQKLLNNIQFTETTYFEKEKSKDYTINLIEIKENGSIFYYPNVKWKQWIDLE